MGRRGQRGCSPMGTLPRCGPSCHGKLVSYPHHVTLVFMPSLLFFPLQHNHFCPSHSDLAFACSLGIPLEVKSCLCSSWEQCLSRHQKGNHLDVIQKEKRAESTQKQSQEAINYENAVFRNLEQNFPAIFLIISLQKGKLVVLSGLLFCCAILLTAGNAFPYFRIVQYLIY